MIGQKKVMGIITMSLLVFVLAACNLSSQDVYEELSKTEITDNGSAESNTDIIKQKEETKSSDDETDDQKQTIVMNDSNDFEKDANMIMTIGDTKVDVSWEDNDSVRELKELAKKNLLIQMSMYGGFEQVGSIGQSVTRNDKQTTTEPGDIVLYSGNQLVVFYGSNSWSYTRLGKINLSDEELENLLGNGDVTITLSME
ncbi:hypothetical protein SAMN04487760_101425 [Lachnospiraceae bacterium G41]|nr:hypothetical protein SAMN04487760_101425 [Lachnospiraceae bacterium G41]